MDTARRDAIWNELKAYDDDAKLGYPLSSITVGELCELISDNAGQAETIEGLQGCASQLIKMTAAVARSNDALLKLKQERDAALDEIERLKDAFKVCSGNADEPTLSRVVERHRLEDE